MQHFFVHKYFTCVGGEFFVCKKKKKIDTKNKAVLTDIYDSSTLLF